jgi:pyruvate kinase
LLRADKGINLPDSALHLSALTEKDIEDLAFVVRHADLIGMSFVHSAGDVHQLQTELDRLGAAHLGIVLKIETASGFEQLPKLLLAAMRSERVGVMIARGDLAVECGYERLAEVQEEILWFSEAAHVPVIWATQVLETLAKKGMPSRAEITDAAMGERAECVMLNKGPHLVEAVRVLNDILQRMEAHQSKKSARLRRLRLSAIASTP